MRQQVNDEGDARQYWIQLPNIVCEIGLKPLELALYVHLKRAAGSNPSGKCFKSTATLAKETGMGAGTVSRTKTALEAKRAALGNRPLIRTREIPNPRGGKAFQEITITDIWKTNTDRFAPSTVEVAYPDSPSSVELGAPNPSSPVEIQGRNQVPLEVDPSSKPISSVEIKKNSKKNIREEEETRNFLSDLKADPFYSHVDFNVEVEKMLRWLARPENKGRKFTERFVLNWLEKIDRPVALPKPETVTDRAAWEAEQRRKMGWDKLEQRTA
jgi:hypothetical protein